MGEFKKRSFCILCKSDRFQVIVNLGPTPLANKLVEDKISNSFFYPLDLVMCQECGHIQLGIIIDTSFVFSDYPYRSSTGRTSLVRLENLASDLFERFISESSQKKLNVFEIGSNDGALLEFFMKLDCTVLGIDPALSAVEEARSKGVDTIHSFFTKETLKTHTNVKNDWDLILMNNVLAHSNEVLEILEGISGIMSYNTKLVIEFSYLIDIFENNLFDTIYHEHISYFYLEPISKALEKFGLKIFDVERFNAHGGSLRLFIVKSDNTTKINEVVNELISYENKIDIRSHKNWSLFRNNIGYLESEIIDELRTAQVNFDKVVGYGIPAKFSTMFYALGMSADFFTFFVDDNIHKVGKLVPGLDEIIKPVSEIFTSKPEIIFVFCWNYKEDVIEFIRNQCHFVKKIIIPLPNFEIIDNN